MRMSEECVLVLKAAKYQTKPKSGNLEPRRQKEIMRGGLTGATTSG